MPMSMPGSKMYGLSSALKKPFRRCATLFWLARRALVGSESLGTVAVLGPIRMPVSGDDQCRFLYRATLRPDSAAAAVTHQSRRQNFPIDKSRSREQPGWPDGLN